MIDIDLFDSMENNIFIPYFLHFQEKNNENLNYNNQVCMFVYVEIVFCKRFSIVLHFTISFDLIYSA